MKKIIYIVSFTFLGFLTQLLAHAIIEILYIGLLVNNFDKYSLGLSWNNWFLIHVIGTIVLSVVGILLGFWQGKFWWRKIYELK